jgi:hypothetical protein
MRDKIDKDNNVIVKDALVSLSFHPRELKSGSIRQERQSEQSRLEKLKVRLRERMQAEARSAPEAA